jgi:hypothetical protein
MLNVTDTVNAADLSCQGLTYCIEQEDGTVRHYGQLVTGYHKEITRRGDWHVHGCDLIGHMGEALLNAPDAA